MKLVFGVYIKNLWGEFNFGGYLAIKMKYIDDKGISSYIRLIRNSNAIINQACSIVTMFFFGAVGRISGWNVIQLLVLIL
jgi:enoyl-[acyl-carrier-protein] reductase (NADH)